MSENSSLASIVRDMLVRAGLSDVYDFAPSALDCACPIVVKHESYEQTDLLDDCEYGTATLGIAVVRETKDDAFNAAADVVSALHRSDWERYNDGSIAIRKLTLPSLPEDGGRDGSGRHVVRIALNVDVFVEHGA